MPKRTSVRSLRARNSVRRARQTQKSCMQPQKRRSGASKKRVSFKAKSTTACDCSA